jgi:hypothetical protein
MKSFSIELDENLDRILEITVNYSDVFSFSKRKSHRDRRLVAEVPAQPNAANTTVG